MHNGAVSIIVAVDLVSRRISNIQKANKNNRNAISSLIIKLDDQVIIKIVTPTVVKIKKLNWWNINTVTIKASIILISHIAVLPSS
jgi:hypothetical protein